MVVWEDNRNGNWDIYGYSISAEKEIPIATEEGDQRYPAIYGDMVVWAELYEGYLTIYYCTLQRQDNGGYTPTDAHRLHKETTMGDQRYPAIYGDMVVWEDNRDHDWDIYGYSILTEEEIPIATEEGDQRYPAIYGDMVVWEDYRNDNGDIYVFNISTRNEFQITTSEDDQNSPAIYGDIVVWADLRYDYTDIYGYNISTKDEFPITTTEKNQRFPVIYKNIVVWQDHRHGNWDIYRYSISAGGEFSIAGGPERQTKSNSLMYMVIFLIIAVTVVLIYGIYKFSPPKEEMKNKKTYKVNALKDPLSKIVLGRWQNYAIILAFFLGLQVATSIYCGSFTIIDADSLPREEEVVLKEEVIFIPTLKELSYFFYYLAATIICILARIFFQYIPEAFDTLHENGIIKKRKVEGSTRDAVLDNFNQSLKELEGRLNHKAMYLPAALLSLFGLLTYVPSPYVEDLGFVGWRHFQFFPANWILFVVIAFSMFFMLAALMWKIVFIVHFMWKLNKHYVLELKPYDLDELGGFKPLEQLWFYMAVITCPVIFNFFSVFVLDPFSGSAYYPPGRFPPLILYVGVIAVFLICPVLIYHHIVESQKSEFLKKVEKKIKPYYEEMEESLLEEEASLNKDSKKEIEHLDEIAQKVKSISSWPFTTMQKASILLGTISAVTPWITQIINYIK